MRQSVPHPGRYHAHNLRMNLADGVFFAVGFAGVVPGTIIASFLSHYTGNQLVLGLPVFISNIMFAVMPFLASFVSSRFQNKKRAVVVIGALQRVSWIPVLLSVVLLGDRPSALLTVFLASYTLFYVLWGLNSLFWRELMGRVFVPERQTSAMGTREALANIAGSVSGIGVMAVLSGVVFPRNFLVLFFVFLVAFSFCLVWVSRLRESPDPSGVLQSPARHLRSLLELPRRDRAFRWFVVFVFFSYGNLFTGSLYTTIGIGRFGRSIDPDRLAGLMTLIMLLSNSVFALVMGRIADRCGRFWGYLPSVVLGVVLPIWAALARTPVLYLGVFLLLGAPNASWFMELFATLGFAPPEKRHLYIAFLSLVKIVPITIYINLGGWIAEHGSPLVTLGISSLFCLAGLAVLLFRLRPIWRAP